MTTMVKVNAFCSGEKEVVVRLIGGQHPDIILQNGQETVVTVYDSIQAQVEERLKIIKSPEVGAVA